MDNNHGDDDDVMNEEEEEKKANIVHDNAIPEVKNIVRQTLNNIFKNIFIKFLTVNFYKYLTCDLKVLIEFELCIYITESNLAFDRASFTQLNENFEVISSNIIEIMNEKNFKTFFLHYYRYILNRDLILLQESIINDVELKLINTLNQLKTHQFVHTRSSIVVSNNLRFIQKPYPYKSNLLKILSKLICTKIYCPNMLYVKDQPGPKRRCLSLAKIDGSFVNKFIKSITGYIFSFIFNYLIYLLLRYQYETYVLHGISILCLLSALILFGMTFNSTIRAYILLVLPFFSTLQGRLLILSFCWIVVYSKIYPISNANYKNLQNSYSCFQRIVLKEIVQQKDLDGPLALLFNAMENIQKFCNLVITAAKAIIEFLKEIAVVLKKVITIFKQILNVCDGSFGKPFLLCMHGINDLRNKCFDEYSYPITLNCYLTYLLHPMCLYMQYLQLYCFFLKFLFKAIKFIFFEIFNVFFRDLFNRLRETFWFSVKSSHDFRLDYQQDNTLGSIVTGIAKDVGSNVTYIKNVAEDIDYIFPVSIMIIIYRTWRYMRKYKSKTKYDNYTIGVKFEKLDETRYLKGYQILLPLKRHLKSKYVRLCSIRQTSKESIETRAALVLFIATFIPIVYALAMDQFLIHLCKFIIKHLYIKTVYLETPGGVNNLNLQIEGKGFVSNIYRLMFRNFEHLTKLNYTIDTSMCMPNIVDADYFAYKQIGIYLFSVFLLSLSQAYLQRLRSVFMGTIWPLRDEERAIWLYNHIMIFERKGFHFSFNPKKEILKKAQPPGLPKLWFLKCLLHLCWFLISKIIYKLMIILLKFSISLSIFVILIPLKILNLIICLIYYCCVTLNPACMAFDIFLRSLKIGCKLYWKNCWRVTKKFTPKFLQPNRILAALKRAIKTGLLLLVNCICRGFTSMNVSCDLCQQKGIGLEFRTCLEDNCQKSCCFKCYKITNQECPFCMLMALNKDELNESIEMDSSIASENTQDENEIKSFFNDYNVDFEDEESREKLKQSDNDDDETFDQDENLNENESVMVDGKIYKRINYTANLNPQREKFYLQALATIKGAFYKRSILNLQKKDIFNAINIQLEPIFRLLQSSDYYSNVKNNFEKLIMQDDEIKNMFFKDSNDLYEAINEEIFDNIVNNIELHEYFEINELKKASFYKKLKHIHEDLIDT